MVCKENTFKFDLKGLRDNGALQTYIKMKREFKRKKYKWFINI